MVFAAIVAVRSYGLGRLGFGELSSVADLSRFTPFSSFTLTSFFTDSVCSDPSLGGVPSPRLPRRLCSTRSLPLSPSPSSSLSELDSSRFTPFARPSDSCFYALVPSLYSSVVSTSLSCLALIDFNFF